MDESLAKIRHERSVRDFPELNLQEGEYIEFAFKRAHICYMMIIMNTFLAIILILTATLFVLMTQLPIIGDAGRNFVFIILGTLLVFAILSGYISLRVYNGNRLFITNRRVIQKIMSGLTFRSFNIIDLASVEDISFHQNGIIANLCHFGTLRLATVGDETTYTFKYSDISRQDLDAVSKLITDAKKPKRRSKGNDSSESTDSAETTETSE